jgi:putative copper resistance protein D
MIISLANVLLYVCLAIVMGYFLLIRIPQKARPVIIISEKQVQWIILFIPILLAVPVIRVVMTLYNQFSLPTLNAVQIVLLEYSTGQAFLVSVGISIILSVYFSKLKGNSIALLFVTTFILLSSWSSHGASVAGLFGFIGNSLHLLAVSVWIGTLAVVAWFTDDWNDTRLFFRWFSNVAIIAVVVIIGSGFMLMSAIVPEYVQAWLLSYGQLLLLKHLLFLPLLIFGVHHFLLGLRKVEFENKERLIGSFRIETLIALLVFAISAVMTEQTPPHEVAQTLQTEKVSALMRLFIGEPTNFGVIHLSGSLLTSVMFGVVMILFAAAAGSLLRLGNMKSSVSFFAIGVLLFYVSLMTSVEVGGYNQEETEYKTVKEAISETYHEDASLELLAMEQDQDEIYVVYSVDQQDLVTEKLIETEGGYKRLPAAMLTIGGTPIVDEQQKIRTFRVENGNWHNEDYQYTFVTFGIIQEPLDVARVQIHYEGGSYIAQVDKNTFINVVSTNENWADQHPIDFLADDGRVIETYARNVMEEGVYCH